VSSDPIYGMAGQVAGDAINLLVGCLPYTMAAVVAWLVVNLIVDWVRSAL
jgi:hypothetical protein